MKNTLVKTLCIATASVALFGCPDDNDATSSDAQPASGQTSGEQPAQQPSNGTDTKEEPKTETSKKAKLTITVQNLTAGQPLSPVTVVTHKQGHLWRIGEPASVALEELAEGGSGAALTKLSVVKKYIAGKAPVGPGASDTLTLEVSDMETAKLSLATMLVNTNDAFTGLNSIALKDLTVGKPMSYMTRAYDAGTEANSEIAGTIPGPADGGKGFDAVRNDVNRVAMHAGVVSQDDGLFNSVLTQAHRFDNPVAKITVTRTQ